MAFSTGSAGGVAGATLPSDVNPAAGSSPAGGTDDPRQLNLSPAAQEAAAKATIEAIRNQTVSEERSADDIMAAKDRAIDDLKNRSGVLEQALEQVIRTVQDLTQKQVQPAAQKTSEPEPEPSLPDNFEDLPTKKQLEILAERGAKKVVSDALKADRETLFKAIGPQMQRLKTLSDKEDERMIREAFPRFDFKKHEAEMAQARKELPGIRPLEAAKLVATPDELLSVEPTAPPVETGRPSMSAASMGPGARPAPQRENPRAQIDLLLRKAGELSRSNLMAESGLLVEQALKAGGFSLRK